MANRSPIGKSGSSSTESIKSMEHKRCMCGKLARVNTSWSLKNPGRRFYTCSTPKDVLGCHFFEWVDEDFSGRALDVITHLNHRRIYLEEKLKLVEEDLAGKDGKRKTLKEDVKVLVDNQSALLGENRRLKKQLNLCVYVAVTMFVLVLMFKWVK